MITDRYRLFLIGLDIVGVNFLLSGFFVGLSVFLLTWIILCRSFGREYRLQFLTYRNTPVGRYIFRMSLLSGSFGSLMLHMAADFILTPRQIIEAIIK